MVPIIKKKDKNENELEIMRWGLAPFWAKDPSISYKMINARAETINEKASFKYAYNKRRCLVPATGFYEWDKKGKEKIPHYFFLKDQKYFAFAGLYEDWKDPEGKVIESFTIITTKPNSLFDNIRDRMPVILKEEDKQEWLINDDISFLETLLKPYSAEEMDEYKVSTDVNSPKNDNKDLMINSK